MMKSLYEHLGYTFKSDALVTDALTHPSFFSSKKNKGSTSFERLEFIGDRVLGLVIAGALIKKFPKENEGKLSRSLSSLVRRERLIQMAKRMKIDEYLRTERIDQTIQSQVDTLYADACEAMIGAIFLDSNFNEAKEVVLKFWNDELFIENLEKKDPKSVLQEFSQKRSKSIPKYDIVGRNGPDHNPNFIVQCKLNDMAAIGEGMSRKMAENAAAIKMLDLLKVKSI